jgi:aryl sulfotransferase
MNGFYWIASYPKSGNTWLRLALTSLLAGGASLDFRNLDRIAPIAADRDSFEAVLGVESADLTRDEVLALRPQQYLEEAKATRAFLLRKVHDAWITAADGMPLFPAAATRGAIYLLRDPRDVAVSLAHHNGTSIEKAVAQVNDPAAALAAGNHDGRNQLEQPLRDWSSHVASWVDTAQPTPLVLRYEDMLVDMTAALTQAARHLEISANPAVIERAVAASRFDVLQAEEDRAGFREKPVRAGRFFRRGSAGAWHDELSAALATTIEQQHRVMMERFGYL